MKHSLVHWEPNYSVHIPIIDQQHKKLLAICNKLNKIILEKRSKSSPIEEDFTSIIKETMEYVALHFKTEEDIMDMLKYPDREEHKAKHRAFAKRIGTVVDNPLKSDFSKAYNMLLFVKEWLIEHILYEDKEIGRRYKEVMKVHKNRKSSG